MPDQHKKLITETEVTEIREVHRGVDPTSTPKRPIGSHLHKKSDYAVGLWFLVLAGSIFMALMIGGYIRLTESELSMVDYRPIANMKPPFSPDEWEAEFKKYQQYPDIKRHPNITMDEFKFSYRLNYVHRMGARLLGLVFLIPMIIFWAKGAFDKKTKIITIIMACLLLLQAFMGWYMLQSGLDKQRETEPRFIRPCVYRVVAHFSIAVSLYSLALCSAFHHLLHPEDHSKVSKIKKLRTLACATKVVIIISLVWGAFVAANDASQIHNDWPLYSGRIIPAGFFSLSPFWANFFENPGTVQFLHRHLGYLTVFMVTVLYVFGHKLMLSKAARVALTLLLIFTFFQAFMGITTLWFKAPTWLASFHQHGGIGLLTFAMLFCHEIRDLPASSYRV